MSIRCLNCGHKISLAWFELSSHSTKYRCVKCKSLHEFTQRRKYTSAISVLLMLALERALSDFITLDVLRVALVLLLSLGVSLLIPGLYKLSKE